MAKFSKILPRILLTICVLILVSSILLSAIFAKYVTSNNTTDKIGRPAAFEVLMEKEFDDLMHISFAADGEPGNPLGHTRVTKDYKFSVVSNYTEVALTYDLIIEFNSVVGKMMYTGKTNPFADGISCYYEVYEVTDEGETKLSGTEILSGTAVTKWTYTKPYLAPNPDTQRKNNYILRVTFYNNTDMTVNSNGYTFSSDAVTITANARQVNVNRSLSASIINGTQTAWNMSDGIDRTPLYCSRNRYVGILSAISKYFNFSIVKYYILKIIKNVDRSFRSFLRKQNYNRRHDKPKQKN